MSEHYLEPTDRPILYAVTGSLGSNAVAEHGMTNVGDATGIEPTLSVASGENENEFIGSVPAEDWPELPEAGTWLEAGDIYQWNDQAVMVRQSHNRTEHDPPDVPALFIVYREDDGLLDWVAGEQVYVGTRRLYNDTEYACLQAHVTQADWTPDITPAMWSVVTPPTEEWQPGIYYTGDNTAGAGNGDVVTYGGNEYRCWQSHTSQVGWEPPNVPALWIAL